MSKRKTQITYLICIAIASHLTFATYLIRGLDYLLLIPIAWISFFAWKLNQSGSKTQSADSSHDPQLHPKNSDSEPNKF